MESSVSLSWCIRQGTRGEGDGDADYLPPKLLVERQDTMPLMSWSRMRAFVSAGIPVTKEPNGLSRSDSRRPDGLSLLPWQKGKPLCWDVTVICPLPNSYLSVANNMKALSVVLDRRLTFRKHAMAVARSCNYHSQAIRHIRYLLSTELAVTLACSLILTRCKGVTMPTNIFVV